MKLNSLIIFLCFIIISNVSLDKVTAEPDPFPTIKIPVLPDAHQITEFRDNPKGTKSINYYIQVEYPADRVFIFYDSKFKELSWTASSDIKQKNWESFIDGTIKGNPKVRQRLVQWTNPELRAEAILALRYIKVGKKWGDNLHILCQIQPMIDKITIEQFIRKLQASREYAKFMELIDLYRKSNGEVDIERAIRENPGNENLKEYKRIADRAIGTTVKK